jgi:hypothetical protein
VTPGQDRTPEELFLDEMVEGYRDGRKLDNPEPSANRSDSYSFANGRDDRAGSPRAPAAMLRSMADKAIADDVARLTRPARPPVISDGRSRMPERRRLKRSKSVPVFSFAEDESSGATRSLPRI